MNYNDFIKRINICYPNEKIEKQKEIEPEKKGKENDGKHLHNSGSRQQQFADTNQ